MIELRADKTVTVAGPAGVQVQVVEGTEVPQHLLDAYKAAVQKKGSAKSSSASKGDRG